MSRSIQYKGFVIEITYGTNEWSNRFSSKIKNTDTIVTDTAYTALEATQDARDYIDANLSCDNH